MHDKYRGTRRPSLATDALGGEPDTFAAEVVAHHLRSPVLADPTLAARVMHAVRADAHAKGSWWRRPIAVRFTPLRVAAVAAGLAAVYAGAQLLPDRSHSAAARPDLVAAARDTVHVVRFVFVAPGASSVALVGDFNGWSLTAHQLTRTGARGVWSTSVALPRGRHEYVFVVDGKRWVADPAATSSIADEFGGESSTITVGRNDAPRAS